MENENLSIDNLEELKNEVKMSGFNNHFDREITDRIQSGQKEFQLQCEMEVRNDVMQYTLHFRVDDQRRKGHFNNMDAVLKDAATGEERKHTFPRYLRITAKEAFNLLKFGEETAVQKRLFNKEGERYLSYVTLDLKGEKDERNNYPVKQYHENYYKEQPFVLEDALQKLPVPVKELENPASIDFILASLKRGNSHEVTIFHGGRVEKGYLMINAKAGRVEVKDANMQTIKNENKAQKVSPRTKQETVEEKRPEIKKKSSQEVKPDFRFPEARKKGRDQHRGL